MRIVDEVPKKAVINGAEGIEMGQVFSATNTDSHRRFFIRGQDGIFNLHTNTFHCRREDGSLIPLTDVKEHKDSFLTVK